MLLVTLLLLMFATVGLGVGVYAFVEQQFRQQTDPRPTAERDRSTPQPSTLPIAVSGAIEVASRSQPRNSSEAHAMARLREAFQLAVDGDFEREVGAAIDAHASSVAWHDIRRDTIGGPSIDHLVVTSAGVLVIDSVVRNTKVTLGPDEVYIGRGRDRRRDPLVDNVLREMAAVVSLVGTVPVHGAIVFRDVLTLPDEIRRGRCVRRGVDLLTPAALDELLSRPGTITDPLVVLRSLQESFVDALPPTATGRAELAGGELGRPIA